MTVLLISLLRPVSVAPERGEVIAMAGVLVPELGAVSNGVTDVDAIMDATLIDGPLDVFTEVPLLDDELEDPVPEEIDVDAPVLPVLDELLFDVEFVVLVDDVVFPVVSEVDVLTELVFPALPSDVVRVFVLEDTSLAEADWSFAAAISLSD